MRFARKSYRLITVLTLVVVSSGFVCVDTLPGQSSKGRSSSSYLRRMREQEQAKIEALKKQRIASLQSQHQAAQRQLEQARPQLSAAEGEIKSAQSRMESTKRIVDADEEEVRNLRRRLDDAEQQVLANRPADATDVVKATEVHQLQRKLDARMHGLLQLPYTEPAETESERTRQSEVLHLTAEQKNKLKGDAEYGQLGEQLAAATKELKSLQQAALEGDKDWTTAKQAWQSARDKLAEKEEDHRRATGANAMARKSLKAATATVASAQGALRQTEAELRSLGAQPQAAAAAKK